jgi:hypothetical protein
MNRTHPFAGARTMPQLFRFAVLLLMAFATTLLIGGCAARQAPVAASTPDGQPDFDIPFEVERIRRDFELGSDIRIIRVRNPHGDLQVRRTGARTLGMLAIVQELGTKPEQPQFVESRQGEVFRLDVRYPSDKRLGEDARPHGHLKGRADVGLYVPAGYRVELEATYGQIYVRRIPNDVDLKTREGDILAGAGGNIIARSARGNIGVYPYAPQWTGRIELEADAGDINVQVPLALGVDIDVRAARDVTVDFGGAERSIEAEEGVRLRMENPDSQRILRARSKAGYVHVREMVPIGR